MASVSASIDRLAAETGFSGVVRVDRGAGVELTAAYGTAHRGYGIPNTIDTRFGIASGTKGLTALTVVSLVVEGRLDLATTARSVLGDDLPLIDDDVTVEHLLAHRSGIGDYVDEDVGYDGAAYLMPVPVHLLADADDYLRVLDGHPAKFRPGERFCYCNSGYVILALIAERVTQRAFAELVVERVCEPAGMLDTAFLRSDEPSGRVATGYLEATGNRLLIGSAAHRLSGSPAQRRLVGSAAQRRSVAEAPRRWQRGLAGSCRDSATALTGAFTAGAVVLMGRRPGWRD